MSVKELILEGHSSFGQMTMPGFEVQYSSPILPKHHPRHPENSPKARKNEIEEWHSDVFVLGRDIPARETSGEPKRCRRCQGPLYYNNFIIGFETEKGVELPREIIKRGEKLPAMAIVLSELRCPVDGRRHARTLKVNREKTKFLKYPEPPEKK